jgi:hypothetical protein
MTDKPVLPTDRKFGLFFAAIFLVLSGYFLWQTKTNWAVGLGVVGGVFGLFALARPRLLQPLNRGWMAIGLLLGKVFSPIVLSVMFFGLITPIAVFFRLIGRDELRIRNKPPEASFWRTRQLRPDGQTTSFKDQY